MARLPWIGLGERHPLSEIKVPSEVRQSSHSSPLFWMNSSSQSSRVHPWFSLRPWPAATQSSRTTEPVTQKSTKYNSFAQEGKTGRGAFSKPVNEAARQNRRKVICQVKLIVDYPRLMSQNTFVISLIIKEAEPNPYHILVCSYTVLLAYTHISDQDLGMKKGF